MTVFCSHQYQYQAKIFILGNRYNIECWYTTNTGMYTCTISCHFVFTMYELVLKEKPTLLVWNYFELQVSVDVKLINFEKLYICCIMSSRCWKKLELAKKQKSREYAYSLDVSQETLPKAVCRAHRNAGGVLAKYRYIFKILNF